MNQQYQQAPKLAPPGAGIPLLHQLFLRLIVKPFVAAKAPWESSTTSFKKIHSKILKETEGLSHIDLQRRILVPSITGLEDSSRYWSIAMCLEHILIVGNQIKPAIVELSHNREIDKTVSTALVKPLGRNDMDQLISEFTTFVHQTPDEVLKKIKDPESKTTLKHPWFGPFTPKAWYWLLGMHGGIHLKQIREIKKRL